MDWKAKRHGDGRTSGSGERSRRDGGFRHTWGQLEVIGSERRSVWGRSRRVFEPWGLWRSAGWGFWGGGGGERSG